MNLKAMPYITSKMDTWKRFFNCLQTVINNTGFGWNDKLKMIECDSEEVWAEFEKVMINLLNFILLILLLFIWFRKRFHIGDKYIILNLQKDKYVKYVRGKPILYYDNWVEIWENDRATEEYV